MRQQLKDTILLVKTDRRIWAAAAFVVVALFVWMLTSSPAYQTTAPGLKSVTASPMGQGPKESYNDLIRAMRQDILKGNRERKEMALHMQRGTEEFKKHRQQVTGIFETLADKFEALAGEVQALADEVGKQREQPMLPQEVELQDTYESERLGWDQTPPDPPKPEPSIMKVSVITPGDSVKVKLLTGVNAPVDGTPYPVVFGLNGSVTGPDGSSLDLGEARIIAAATGSEADGRALFRLTSLAMRHQDGRRSVIDIDGWIVGEDGVRGMKGRLIDKLGRLIVATAGVSFVSALGERVDGNQGYLRQIDDEDRGVDFRGNDFEVSSASALFDASNRLGEILLDRYESLVPVVEVLSGREVVAIFNRVSEVAIVDDGDYPGGGIYASSLD